MGSNFNFSITRKCSALVGSFQTAVNYSPWAAYTLSDTTGDNCQLLLKLSNDTEDYRKAAFHRWISRWGTQTHTDTSTVWVQFYHRHTYSNHSESRFYKRMKNKCGTAWYQAKFILTV